MKKIALASVLLALAVSAAGQAPPPTDERVNYWRQKLTQDLPVGSAKSTILEWASKNHLKASQRPQAQELTIRLESASAVPAGSGGSQSAADCSYYLIRATLKLDAKESLVSTDVQMAQNCL